MRGLAIIVVLVTGCASTPRQGSPRDCRQRCDQYKPENEGGWSGLWKQVDTDGTKYKQCMDLCLGRN